MDEDEDHARGLDWKQVTGVELVRQAPHLVVLLLLAAAFLWSIDRRDERQEARHQVAIAVIRTNTTALHDLRDLVLTLEPCRCE